ncbi:hypothetical protein [Agrobacterium tumefaciens]|uniref:hypothetical protein n=1 Tax=Agrobacterium tumefaciens TaxID=358 RepID=UPI002FDB1E78
MSDVEPSDFHREETEEQAIPCPAEQAEQLALVKSISGQNGRDGWAINQELLRLLRTGRLTESAVAQLLAEWKERNSREAA